MKILFFSPNSAIWVHAFPEALVAEAAAQQGNEVVYVGCGGQLGCCVSPSAYRIPFGAERSEKERICRLCKKNEEIIRAHFGFTGVDLDDVVVADDLSYADEALSSVTPENLLDLVIDGVEVGRIALYELLLEVKKISLDFSPDEWKQYKASLKDAIVVLRGTQRIVSEMHPDRIVLYNALYTVNRVVSRFAELRGIPQYFLHAGGNLSNRLQTLMLARGNTFTYFQHMRYKWREVKENPCSPDVLRAVTDHFLEVIRGRSAWAYSSAAKGGDADLRQFFGVDAGQKVICATMSSYDERFAAETVGAISADIPLLFPKQADWVRALINFVANRRDLSLIIRVHPREFPNKRDGVLSEHARMLQGVLSQLPSNVRINWPTDDVSLYDLANITDVFLNAWSSTGKEMALLGIPVLLYSHDLVLYPSELNYVGTTEQEYFQQLEQALLDGWSSERIRKTYRWCAMEYAYSLLDISESYSKNEYRQGSFFSKVVNKLMTYIAPCREQERDCRNRSAQLSISGKIDRILKNKLDSVLDLDGQDAFASYAEETDGLKREVRRLIDALYGDTRINVQQNSLTKRMIDFANS